MRVCSRLVLHGWRLWERLPMRYPSVVVMQNLKSSRAVCVCDDNFLFSWHPVFNTYPLILWRMAVRGFSGGPGSEPNFQFIAPYPWENFPSFFPIREINTKRFKRRLFIGFG